jgi:hypothetical protein
MKEIKKKIEEILKEYNRNYKEYTLEAAMENNPTPDDILIEDIIALIQKEREDAIKGYVKWAWNNGLGGLVDDDSVKEYLSQTKGGDCK